MIGTDKTQPLHIKQSIPVFVALYIGSRLLTGFTLGAVMVIVDLGSIFGFVLCAGSFFTLHLTAFQTRFF
jgi:FtsH-binding integral membrane protein